MYHVTAVDGNQIRVSYSSIELTTLESSFRRLARTDDVRHDLGCWSGGFNKAFRKCSVTWDHLKFLFYLLRRFDIHDIKFYQYTKFPCNNSDERQLQSTSKRCYWLKRTSICTRSIVSRTWHSFSNQPRIFIETGSTSYQMFLHTSTNNYPADGSSRILLHVYIFQK